MGFEIEKKFLVKALPSDLERFPYHRIAQGYLCRQPAVRVRCEQRFSGADAPDSERCYMTYKGFRTEGRLAQEEYNLALTEDAYAHLLSKADGAILEKRRYLIPLNRDAFSEESVAADSGLREWLAVRGEGAPGIELDIFEGAYDGLVVAEVEFPTEGAAAAYRPADWFDREVTGDPRYSNAWLAEQGRLPTDMVCARGLRSKSQAAVGSAARSPR